MHAIRQPAGSIVNSTPVKTVVEEDLALLSRQTGVGLETLRTFASIDAPLNKSMFSAEAAKKAFSSVKLRKVEF